MAGRDGEEVPDQRLGEGEEELPDPDVEEVPIPNPDDTPPPRGVVPKRGRPKGSTRLSKEDILRRLASRPKVTSTPRTRAMATRGIREDPSPLVSVDIASLIKVPTFPAPRTRETIDLGAKTRTNPRKSVQITEEIESES